MTTRCRKKDCAHRKAAIDALLAIQPRTRALSAWAHKWLDVPLPPPDPKRQAAGSKRWAGLTADEKSALGKHIVSGRLNKERPDVDG